MRIYRRLIKLKESVEAFLIKDKRIRMQSTLMNKENKKSYEFFFYFCI